MILGMGNIKSYDNSRSLTDGESGEGQVYLEGQGEGGCSGNPSLRLLTPEALASISKNFPVSELNFEDFSR